MLLRIGASAVSQRLRRASQRSQEANWLTQPFYALMSLAIELFFVFFHKHFLNTTLPFPRRCAYGSNNSVTKQSPHMASKCFPKCFQKQTPSNLIVRVAGKLNAKMSQKRTSLSQNFVYFIIFKSSLYSSGNSYVIIRLSTKTNLLFAESKTRFCRLLPK